MTCPLEYTLQYLRESFPDELEYPESEELDEDEEEGV